MSIPICDFCSSPDVRWAYPAKSFTMDGDGKRLLGSDGGWAACDACAALIEDGNRTGLLDKSVGTFDSRHVIGVAATRELIGSLHAQFYLNRNGHVLTAEEFQQREGMGKGKQEGRAGK